MMEEEKGEKMTDDKGGMAMDKMKEQKKGKSGMSDDK